MANEIMTPQHPEWETFIFHLEGPEGCDFKQEIPGDAESITWKCEGGNNKNKAASILKKYYGYIDVEKSLQYFDEHGGHCDCEILFNVEATSR